MPSLLWIVRKISSAAVMLVAVAAVGAEPPRAQTPEQAYYGNPRNAASFFADARVAALAVSAARGQLERIDQLIAQGVNPNAEGQEEMTPLAWAMEARNKAGFRRLLERGAQPDALARARGYEDFRPAPWLPIRDAAANRDDSWWLETLLAHGANPNLVQPKRGGDDTLDYSAGTTPLFSALESGRVENVDLLIKAGADLNHQDNRGNCPLYYTAMYVRDFALVLRLLAAGADYRIANNDGHDVAFQMAYLDGDEDRAYHENRLVRQVIALLEKNGVDMAAARKRAADFRRQVAAKVAARTAERAVAKKHNDGN
jgi:ankyrin repeat protein